MKHSIPTKLLSLLLAVVLLLSCSPFAYASELGMDGQTEPDAVVTEAAEATQAAEETEETESAEATEETQAAQETEAVEETTEVTEETEATEATEETEATEATEPDETTPETPEPGILPYGLKGLPEGYVLSDEEQAARQESANHDVAGTTAGLTAGKDYEEGVLILTAQSQEQAQLYAEAYSAELLSYSWRIAKIRLTTATVPEAMAAAQDLSLPLPPASPNHITTLDPIPAAGTLSAWAPTEQSWNTWVNENMDDPDPALQSPTSRIYQYMHDAVDTYAAWGVNTGDGWGETIVAVLDSGVQADHPDLAGKVATHDIGLGTSDEAGHGTHVAGIIAATMNNGKGGAGIAPNAKILSIRVADADGDIDTAALAGSIYYAVIEGGADVINLSLRYLNYNIDLHGAINYALSRGVVVVAAMGNEGSNTYCYPAAFEGVISVMATGRNNERASFSNYGAWADIAAPGVAIYSCVPNSGYDLKSGTSMAAPVVSGVVALYMNTYHNEDLSPAAIRTRLKSTATRGGSSLGTVGIVNAAKMLSIKPRTPGFTIYSKSDELLLTSDVYTNQVVPCESVLDFHTYDGDQNWYLLYTTDGKQPSVLNGEVVHGTRVTGLLDLEEYAGQTLNLKVMQVNGMGMASSVLSKRIKVAASTQITKVTVSGPTEMIEGGTAEFTAVVEPKEKAVQTVTWTIDYFSMPDLYGAKIDPKTGKLTLPRYGTGYVSVYAVAANGLKSDIHKVVVRPMPSASKMVMTPPSPRPSMQAGEQITLGFYAMDSSGHFVDPEVRWTSSNPKVATVDDKGTVTAIAKGIATITVKALDGSNKSATCSVTVTQPVTDIYITRQLSIAPGSSALCKAEVFPKTANNKQVRWFLSDAPYGVTISATGMISVASYVREGSEFLVVAQAKDGSGIQRAARIVIARKCSGVVVRDATTSGRAPGVTKRDRNGNITSVELFNVDLPNTSGIENQIKLTAYTLGVSAYCDWISSNPAIAEVDLDGNVTAYKAGTVTLSCVALDGSNKQARVSLKVTVPASTISISSNALRRDTGAFEYFLGKDVYYLGFGKNASNKAVFSDTYGKPTNQKVTWDFTVKTIDSDGNVKQDLTSRVKNNKYVTLSNGTLMVKSDMRNLWGQVSGEILITVTATAQDGTRATGSINYALVPLATDLHMDYRYKRVYAGINDQYRVPFFSNQLFPFDQDVLQDFIITSSNPKVASAFMVESASSNNNGWYWLYFNTGMTPGTATITIKAVDGSNKFCSFTVTVG